MLMYLPWLFLIIHLYLFTVHKTIHSMQLTKPLETSSTKMKVNIMTTIKLCICSCTCTSDSRMGSPPPLEGASHTTGGILRGKAAGNVFNHGDSAEIYQEPIVVKGLLKIYTALVESASQVKPTMVLKINVFTTMAPLLKKLSDHYPTVKCKFNILSLLIINNLSAHNQFIYVLESSFWCTKGRLLLAVEDDEDVEWSHETGVPTLSICVVSHLIAL